MSIEFESFCKRFEIFFNVSGLIKSHPDRNIAPGKGAIGRRSIAISFPIGFLASIFKKTTKSDFYEKDASCLKIYIPFPSLFIF